MTKFVPVIALAFLATPLVGITAHADNAEPVSPVEWQPQAGDKITFNVRRNGGKFGKHSVSFDRATDGSLTASTNVLLKAGLGPITVYKYELSATETWRNGELVALTGKVNNDGDKGTVTASAQGDMLSVDGTEFSGTVPVGIIPSSHWNMRQMMGSEMLSTEDGEVIEMQITEKGRETITAAGQSIEATRYLMDSDIDVDLWYDDLGRWVKLAFATDGQNIEYILASDY